MKVSRTKNTAFAPIAITLTIENEAEARAMYAIFNYTPNCDLLSDVIVDNIKHAIGDYSVPGNGEIANGIRYADFYRGKTSL